MMMSQCEDSFPSYSSEEEMLSGVENSTAYSYSEHVYNVTYPVIANSTHHAHQTLYFDLRYHVYDVIIPCILCIGLLGNGINLAVFSFRMSQSCVDRMEKSATAGLIAIALSDLLFCVIGIPAAFVPHTAYYMAIHESPGVVFAFYYNIYKGALANLFLLISTWLIVVISVERYLAVCHPIRARWLIAVRKTVIGQCSVAGLALLLCLPEFLFFHVHHEPCGACTCYTRLPNPAFFLGSFSVTYKVIWLVLGTLIPLAVLVFCNVRLIVVLYQSKKLGIADPDRYCTTRITAVVVGIISTYFVLVVPSSLVDVIILATRHSADPATEYRLRTAVVLCNLFQAIKFASNFVLYCSINKQFRRSIGLALRRMSTSRSRLLTTRMTTETTLKRVDLMESSSFMKA